MIHFTLNETQPIWGKVTFLPMQYTGRAYIFKIKVYEKECGNSCQLSSKGTSPANFVITWKCYNCSCWNFIFSTIFILKGKHWNTVIFVPVELIYFHRIFSLTFGNYSMKDSILFHDSKISCIYFRIDYIWWAARADING